MKKIPTHKIEDVAARKMVFSRHSSDEMHIATIHHNQHRDDYYVFMLLEGGSVNLLLDFEVLELSAGELCFVQPGQVHAALGDFSGVEGSLLGVDSFLICSEYKEMLNRVSFKQHGIKLKEETIADLKACFSILHRRMKISNSPDQRILNDLVSSYIGLIVEDLQKVAMVSENGQPAVISLQFKQILTEKYQTMKRPSDYAQMLNVSPSYLNECVKKMTGSPVSYWIQNENVLQAKRLLFYTNLTVKEIALQLGYEDWAYFTRLFSKVAKLSPTQFRAEYLKYRD
ncbi:MAG: AraC family transcriptional regulator [Mangrovibacterium sp.]